MKQRFYTFNYYKDGRFFERNSFRDTDYGGAKLQAEVYADKLRFYNEGCKITFKRDYKRMC